MKRSSSQGKLGECVICGQQTTVFQQLLFFSAFSSLAVTNGVGQPCLVAC